jgi:hypothetical protein
MPRRHLRIYRRAKPADEPIADLQRELAQQGRSSSEGQPRPGLLPIDYRPMVAVIGFVIFGLGLIAFLLTLRAR